MGEVELEAACGAMGDDGFARGVVARSNGEGQMFPYFFGPRLRTREEATFSDVTKEGSVLRGLCGDLGILKGEWPLVGTVRDWDRSRWPMPPLFRANESAGRAWLSHYDEDNLSLVREEPVSPEAKGRYPYDRLMGYGAAETTHELAQGDDDDQGDGRRRRPLTMKTE